MSNLFRRTASSAVNKINAHIQCFTQRTLWLHFCPSTQNKTVGEFHRPHWEAILWWLGNRDSNPNYLIQNQAFYR